MKNNFHLSSFQSEDEDEALASSTPLRFL